MASFLKNVFKEGEKTFNNTIIRNGCVLVHKQKHFDDFVLQKELSLRARRHVTCHTHNLWMCTRTQTKTLFDDFVLQKELSLRARRHVTCHTHKPRACTRERERERSTTFATTRSRGACTSTVSALHRPFFRFCAPRIRRSCLGKTRLASRLQTR